MALILNIETATEVCSVALAKDGVLLAHRESSEPKAHAASLTLFIDEVLKKVGATYNELDAIAVSKGPGSYTGLRIGVSTAKGLCFALDKPLISINTLKVFASHFKSHYLKSYDLVISDDILLCPMLDARRMEVYTAVFDQQINFLEPTQALILDDQSFNLLLQSKQVVFFGNGATKWQHFAHTFHNASFVMGFETSAMGMVELSYEQYHTKVFEDIAYFEPLYLKDFITTTPKKNRL